MSSPVRNQSIQASFKINNVKIFHRQAKLKSTDHINHHCSYCRFDLKKKVHNQPCIRKAINAVWFKTYKGFFF